MPAKMRASIFALFSMSEDQLWRSMTEVMHALGTLDRSAKGLDNQTFETFIWLIRLFATYVDCKYYPYRENPPRSQIAALRIQRWERYPDFYAFCQKLDGYFDGQSLRTQSPTPEKPIEDSLGDTKEEEDDEGPQPAVKRRSKAVK
jgi:hypothetical protein